MVDLTIVGAGLAGLQLARLAARGGADVLLIDARRSVTECVRTTGIFVRRTFDDFPILHPFLGEPVRRIGLHSPSGRHAEIESPRDEFRVGRMKPLHGAMLRQAIDAGARWSPATIYASLQRHARGVTIVLRDGRTIESRFIVGADGARSRVARDLELDQNDCFITGIEHVYTSSRSGNPRFDCWIDPRIAPGYLAWLLDDGEEIHAGVGGDPRRFDPTTALATFEKRLRDQRLLRASTPTERRGGLIPVNGVLRRIGNEHGLLVGDAAGAVSPLTAGGLDACMRLSAHAAEEMLLALRSERPLQYDGAAFRTRFASRLAMRHAFDWLTRARPLIELGFAAIPIAMPLIEHVFFARGSFPLESRARSGGVVEDDA